MSAVLSRATLGLLLHRPTVRAHDRRDARESLRNRDEIRLGYPCEQTPGPHVEIRFEFSERVAPAWCELDALFAAVGLVDDIADRSLGGQSVGEPLDGLARVARRPRDVGNGCLTHGYVKQNPPPGAALAERRVRPIAMLEQGGLRREDRPREAPKYVRLFGCHPQ